MVSKLVQVKRIVEDYVDTDSIARKLVEIGFTLPSKKQTIPAGVSGRELILSPKRLYVFLDGWIKFEYYPPIGVIRWYPQWRQYCFFPTEGTVYSKGCLKDIANFIENQMKLRS